MKRTAVFILKGFSYFLVFIFTASVFLHLVGIKTDFEWKTGADDKKIISVAGDGSGNTEISIGDKNIYIKHSDIKSFSDRLSEILK